MDAISKLVIPATPEAVDTLIQEYVTALADLVVLQTRAADLKANMLAIVGICGVMPPTAKSSKRIQGLTHKATVTYGSTSTLDEEAIAKLHAYLVDKEMPELFEKFYALQVPAVYVPPPPKHMRFGSAGDVLQVLTARKIGAAITVKILALYALTQRSSPNAPSLKVETIK